MNKKIMVWMLLVLITSQVGCIDRETTLKEYCTFELKHDFEDIKFTYNTDADILFIMLEIGEQTDDLYKIDNVGYNNENIDISPNLLSGENSIQLRDGRYCWIMKLKIKNLETKIRETRVLYFKIQDWSISASIRIPNKLEIDDKNNYEYMKEIYLIETQTDCRKYNYEAPFKPNSDEWYSSTYYSRNQININLDVFGVYSTTTMIDTTNRDLFGHVMSVYCVEENAVTSVNVDEKIYNLIPRYEKIPTFFNINGDIFRISELTSTCCSDEGVIYTADISHLEKYIISFAPPIDKCIETYFWIYNKEEYLVDIEYVINRDEVEYQINILKVFRFEAFLVETRTLTIEFVRDCIDSSEKLQNRYLAQIYDSARFREFKIVLVHENGLEFYIFDSDKYL